MLHTSPGQPEYMLGLLLSFVAGNVVVLAALALLPGCARRGWRQ